MSLRRSQPLPLTHDHGIQDGWSSSWPHVAVSTQSLVYGAVETTVMSVRAAGSKDGSVWQERQLTQKTKTSWNSPWGWTATNLRGCYSRGKPNLPSKVYPGPPVLFPQLWRPQSPPLPFSSLKKKKKSKALPWAHLPHRCRGGAYPLLP